VTTLARQQMASAASSNCDSGCRRPPASEKATLNVKALALNLPNFLRAALCAALLVLACGAFARVEEARSLLGAAALGARYAELRNELNDNPFRRPIHLDSTEGRDSVTGDIFAVLNAPFATASNVLDKPAQWCDILILHLNNKYCRPAVAGGATTLALSVGKKGEQALSDAYRVNFVFTVSARTAEYLQVSLNAVEGPLSTKDYRVILEATPAEGGGKTFNSASFRQGVVSMGSELGGGGLVTPASLKDQWAKELRRYAGANASVISGAVERRHAALASDAAYVVPAEPGKPAQPVGGMRGAVERNTMRYYLAIEAYFGALSSPPAARLEKSLRDWFAATEAYSKQLHEMDQQEYLAIKRREYSRQQAEMN